MNLSGEREYKRPRCRNQHNGAVSIHVVMSWKYRQLQTVSGSGRLYFSFDVQSQLSDKGATDFVHHKTGEKGSEVDFESHSRDKD